ncbi:transcription antitermination factor NusB [Gemelliphila asaccharolytica]|uniref:Transcription antitermination protein NusB n=1 Tax=Gemelliphila asaccharolytica TaxID=502393 RepID=A0ABR5TPF5_9BACL|nr:transcription antitermination factor NusB [Gemella asaccharolytica]KXB58047.1 transcription antitermination factor NusB [Gemella asaccharolytica]
MKNKSEIREKVFKILFQLENKDLYLNDLSELDNDIFSDDIIIETLKDIKNNLKEVDLIINKNLREWTLSRLSKMDRQILRIATYEILFTDIPYKVSINEALEISKKYSEKDDSYKFINGVLRGVLQNT